MNQPMLLLRPVQQPSPRAKTLTDLTSTSWPMSTCHHAKGVSPPSCVLLTV
jgi:hypothetical protein